MALYVLHGLNRYGLSNYAELNISKGTIEPIFWSLLSLLVVGFNLKIAVEVRILQRKLRQDPHLFPINPGIAF